MSRKIQLTIIIKPIIITLILFFHVLSSFALDVESLKKKANQGDAAAQFSMGHYYAKGKNVLKDYKKAVHWYEKAAKQGHAKAQFYLGVHYTGGYGISKNYKKAAYWCKKAKDNDYDEAANLWNLAELWKYID